MGSVADAAGVTETGADYDDAADLDEHDVRLMDADGDTDATAVLDADAAKERDAEGDADFDPLGDWVPDGKGAGSAQSGRGDGCVRTSITVAPGG